MIFDILATLMAIGISFSWASADFDTDCDIGWVVMPLVSAGIIIWRIWA